MKPSRTRDTCRMLSTEASAPAFAASVVVDLIGDLDATLCGVLTDTLVKLTRNGTRAVLLTTKYVSTASSAGIAGLSDALKAARAQGLEVALEPGNRKMRAAFAGATFIRSAAPETPRDRVRHYMFAHHETAKRARAGGLAQPA